MSLSGLLGLELGDEQLLSLEQLSLSLLLCSEHRFWCSVADKAKARILSFLIEGQLETHDLSKSGEVLLEFLLGGCEWEILEVEIEFALCLYEPTLINKNSNTVGSIF